MPILRGDALFDLFSTEYNTMLAETALDGMDDDYIDEPNNSSDDNSSENVATTEPSTNEPVDSIPQSDFTLALSDAVSDKPKRKRHSKDSTIIQDFGQKLGGAKKDAYSTYKELLYQATVDEVKPTTLNDNWPQPNYTKLIAAGIPLWKVSAIRALRESNFSRVAKKYGMRRDWQKQLVTTRAIAAKVINDDSFDEAAFIETIKEYSNYGKYPIDAHGDGSIERILYHDFESDYAVSCNDPTFYTHIYHQFELYKRLGHDNPLNGYFVCEFIQTDTNTLSQSRTYYLYKSISRDEHFELGYRNSGYTGHLLSQQWSGGSWRDSIKKLYLKELFHEEDEEKEITDLDELANKVRDDLEHSQVASNAKRNLANVPPNIEYKNLRIFCPRGHKDIYQIRYVINKDLQILIDQVTEQQVKDAGFTGFDQFWEFYSKNKDMYLDIVKDAIKSEKNLRLLKKYVVQRHMGSISIGYKAPGGTIYIKDDFVAADEAISDLLQNLDTYTAELNDAKNITERNAENRTRSGDPRVHADITPEEYLKTFGFRGVEFGNWVEGEARQADLNLSYDAFLDLADALGVEPKALSLGGTLGIRFGSNGRGGKNAAAAHYEPSFKAINLTKMHGAGCLAHEWFHALDHYLSNQAKTATTMYSEAGKYPYSIPNDLNGDNIVWLSPQTKKGFATARDNIFQSDLIKRSRLLDATRDKAYWSSRPELMARAFEFYVKEKLADKAIVNDFLVNLVDEDKFGDKKRYPYPLREEKDDICAGYQKLFDAMTTRTNAEGKVEFFSCSRHDCRNALVEASIMLSPERLTEDQRNLAYFAKDCGGIDVKFFEGSDELHGRYDAQENAIYVNAKYDGNMHWIFYHELFHAMKYKMPSVYDDVIESMGFNLPTKEQIADYREETHAANLTDAEITEEILANAFAKQLEQDYQLENNKLTLLEKPKTALDAKQQGKLIDALEDAIDKITRPNGFPDEKVFALAIIPYPDFPQKQVELDTRFASDMLAKSKQPKQAKAVIAETLTKLSPLAHKLNYAKNIIAKAERALRKHFPTR